MPIGAGRIQRWRENVTGVGDLEDFIVITRPDPKTQDVDDQSEARDQVSSLAPTCNDHEASDILVKMFPGPYS